MLLMQSQPISDRSVWRTTFLSSTSVIERRLQLLDDRIDIRIKLIDSFVKYGW